MTQSRFTLTQNGQELQQTDVNAIATNAAVADDQVFIEASHLVPSSSNVIKYIVPFSALKPKSWSTLAIDSGGTEPVPTSLATKDSQPTIYPGTGSINILPFRAVVGSRTANVWTDLRTTQAIGIGGAAPINVPSFNVTFAAGNGSNPRWDLVYCTVVADSAAGTVTRYVKDPTTKIISAQSVTTTTQTTASINVVQGTAQANPQIPALPADSAGSFNIPLCAVQLAASFTSSTVLTNANILTLMPTQPVPRTLGVLGGKVACTLFGGTSSAFINDSSVTNWGNSSANRPDFFMPSDMIGGTMLNYVFYNGQTTTKNTTTSIATLSVIDDTIRWNNRMFMVAAWSSTASAQRTPWALAQSATSGTGLLANTASTPNWQGGQSFINDGQAVTAINTAAGVVGQWNAGQFGSTSLWLYVDYSDNTLRVAYTGTSAAMVFFWIFATAPFTNR